MDASGCDNTYELMVRSKGRHFKNLFFQRVIVIQDNASITLISTDPEGYSKKDVTKIPDQHSMGTYADVLKNITQVLQGKDVPKEVQQYIKCLPEKSEMTVGTNNVYEGMAFGTGSQIVFVMTRDEEDSWSNDLFEWTVPPQHSADLSELVGDGKLRRLVRRLLSKQGLPGREIVDIDDVDIDDGDSTASDSPSSDSIDDDFTDTGWKPVTVKQEPDSNNSSVASLDSSPAPSLQDDSSSSVTDSDAISVSSNDTVDLKTPPALEGSARDAATFPSGGHGYACARACMAKCRASARDGGEATVKTRPIDDLDSMNESELTSYISKQSGNATVRRVNLDKSQLLGIARRYQFPSRRTRSSAVPRGPETAEGDYENSTSVPQYRSYTISGGRIGTTQHDVKPERQTVAGRYGHHRMRTRSSAVPRTPPHSRSERHGLTNDLTVKELKVYLKSERVPSREYNSLHKPALLALSREVFHRASPAREPSTGNLDAMTVPELRNLYNNMYDPERNNHGYIRKGELLKALRENRSHTPRTTARKPTRTRRTSSRDTRHRDARGRFTR